ncbi:FAD-dependent monooxygenase [Sphingomonas sp. Root710]|uniref:FAD-dependent monooxygenase n=1 Tax=Sphingomonas sp. Root710 TaxID=1736594 RepID=UPI000AD91782|nr:FAD-dependent monooxygenase [Sphingomonas sp. Root710]
METLQSTQVLISGAGPAGLALAIELGSRGIACTLIERNDRVGYAPRAKTTHTRTREHFRRWGIADALASASPLGIDYPSDIHFVTRLGGYPLSKIENAFNCAPDRNELYAEHSQWIPQYLVEQIMRDHLISFPNVRVCFKNELISAEQRDQVVISRVRDIANGQEFDVESEYLVGADGARSLVRDIIGAKMEGQYGLAHAYNIVFRAPGLADAHGHGPGIMYWQTNPDIPGTIGPMDRDDLWYFIPGKADEIDVLDQASATDLIRRSTGIDLQFEVLSADEWVASQFIADKYRKGRMFIVGDACHLNPPTGGYGMNLGVSDAVDLGWKLAAVLQGWGGSALLEAYEQERGPVHKFVIDAAVSNHATMALHSELPAEIEADTARGEALRADLGKKLAAGRLQEFQSLGVMLGYSYSGSPIIVSEQCEKPASSMHEYHPTSRPGARAPHAWLENGCSLYDTFGEEFSLLVFDDAHAGDVQRALADAEALNLPLKIVMLHDDRVAKLYERPLVLVRPDQHIAWRGDHWPGISVLQCVTGRTC